MAVIRFPFLSRKSLLFLCVSVASVVFFLPSVAGAVACDYTANSFSQTDDYINTGTFTNGTDYTYTTENTGNTTVCYFGSDNTYTTASSTIVGIGGDFYRAINGTSGGSGSSLCLSFGCASDGYYLSYRPASGTPVSFITYKVTSGTGTPYTVEELTYVYSSSTLNSELSYGFNSTYQTRFTSLDITGTSTVQIDTEYYLHAEELNANISERNPTLVNYEYSRRPSTTLSINGDAITPTAGTSTSEMQLSSLSDGTYDLLVRFSNIGASLGLSARPFPEAYVYTSFTIVGGVLTATGTPEFYDRTEEQEVSQYRDCSITQLQNCLTNAGIFLFIPSNESIENFTTLKESIANKFPFNYVADFKNAFTDFYTTATTETLEITVEFSTFGDITLLSEDLINAVPFASTIRTILGYLLWIMLVLQIYRRTLSIFNSQEKTV